MVIQEEEGRNGGGGGGGGETPKKGKPARIPQRGLGIAALEKLRREEHQKRIEAGDSISAGSGSSTSGGVILHSLPPQSSAGSNFLALHEPSSTLRPLCVGNYAMFRPPLDPRESSAPLIYNWNANVSLPLLPRRRTPPAPPGHQQQQQRFLMNSLSPSSSSTAGAQMEPPSNQSYVSMNTSARAEEQRLVGMKRQWPFQPVISRPLMLLSSASTAHPADHCGVSSMILEENEPKRIGLLREEASSSSSPRNGAAALDGSMLKLGPPCVPVPSPKRPEPTQQHVLLTLQPPQRITDIPAAALGAGGPLVRPALLNFMGLPEHVKEEQRAAIEAACARQQPALFMPALHNFMGLPEHVIEEQRAAIGGAFAWIQPALSMDSPVDLIRSKTGDADARPNASTD